MAQRLGQLQERKGVASAPDVSLSKPGKEGRKEGKPASRRASLSVDGSPVEQFLVRQSLSSVLNNPSRLASRRDAAGSLPNEPVPAPDHVLPRVTLENFRPYLRQIAKGVRTINESRRTLRELEEQSSRPQTTTEESEVLKNVPRLFFSEDFRLDDPEVFEQTCEWGLKPAASLHQEKLSHYLDLVEIELVHQISTRSRDFFTELGRIQYLRDEVTATCREISSLRRTIHRLQSAVGTSLNVTRLQRQKENLRTVYQKMDLISTVRQAQPTVQLLLSNSDFIGALDLIHQTQTVLKTELSGIQSLKHMSLQLSELVAMIGKIMQEDFLARTTVVTAEQAAGELEEQLSPLVLGLMHVNKLHVVLQQYRNKASSLMQQAVLEELKRHIPKSTAAIGSNTIPELLRGMNSEQYLRLLQEDVFPVLLLLLRRAANIHDFLLQLTAAGAGMSSVNSSGGESGGGVGGGMEFEMGKLSTRVSEEYCQQVVAESKEILYLAAEKAHAECAKILDMRKEEHRKLTPGDFTALYNGVTNFSLVSNDISHQQCLSLTGTLQSQAKEFLAEFHGTKKNTIAWILDTEKWTKAPVACEFQQIVDRLTDAVRPPAEEADGATATHLFVEGESFMVVNSFLMLLKLVDEYLEVGHDLPSLHSDVLLKVSEILSLFNSRTCQLVLGAGAVQSEARLKRITARNLALAARCLKAAQLLIPHVKRRLSALFPEKRRRMLADLDRVQRDYTEHCTEITAKLVAILRDRVDHACKNLSTKINWNERSTDVSAYVKSILKDTESLHGILFKVFPPPELELLFSQVFAMYNARLVEYFSTLRLGPVGKKRLYEDIDHLLDGLAQLRGVKEQVMGLMVLRDFYTSQFGARPS